jgi:hypothetical protein
VKYIASRRLSAVNTFTITERTPVLNASTDPVNDKSTLLQLLDETQQKVSVLLPDVEVNVSRVHCGLEPAEQD